MMPSLQSMIGVLGDFYDMYRDEPEYSQLFYTHDIGFPLAWMTWKGVASPTDIGKGAVYESWSAFCEAIRVNPDGEFESFTQMREFMELNYPEQDFNFP